jgi:hypothetical protein
MIEQTFTKTEVSELISDLNKERNSNVLAQSYKKALEMSKDQERSNTMVIGQLNQDNLIKWQLELDSILERIEHILKGDKPTTINGNLIFLPALNENEKILNDYGVSEIMRILTMYLNRNTILSNYDEETINWKVLDFGKEISDLIFLKYEEMGLNTLEKRKRYAMIVKELVDSIHSAYLRAKFGGERDSLREARQITQNESLNQNGMMMPNNNMMMMPRERSILNPMRWLGSKYAY